MFERRGLLNQPPRAAVQLRGSIKHLQEFYQPHQLLSEAAAGAHQIPEVEESFGDLEEDLFAVRGWGVFDHSLLDQSVEHSGDSVGLQTEFFSEVGRG